MRRTGQDVQDEILETEFQVRILGIGDETVS